MKYTNIIRTIFYNQLIRLLILVAFTGVIFPAAAQISVSGWTKPVPAKSEEKPLPSMEVQASQGAAPQIHRIAAMKISALKKYKIAAPTTTEMQPKLNEKKLKIGVVQKLPQVLDVVAESSQLSVDDGVIRAIKIESEGAVQTRLHFSRLDLPENVQMFVYAANNPKEFYGPFRKGAAEFWTPPITGSEAVIEIFIPANTEKAQTEKIKVEVDQLTHVFRHPRGTTTQKAVEKETAQLEAAASCNRDVPTEWSETAKSVALIQFHEQDGDYICSGVLLNDTKNSGTPYFLTANHCVGNAEVANSTEFYWFYDRGSVPPPRGNYGADLIRTSDVSDFSLLKVRTPVPAGIRFSGWTTAKPAVSTPVTGIHHPRGDYKRFTTGRTESTACPTFMPSELCENFHEVKWNSGISEPGSSGGGLWVGSASDPKLIGQLLGGGSDCPTPDASDYFGRFDITMEAVAQYLTGQGCQHSLSHSKQLMESGGGTAKVEIFANEVGDCAWTVRSNASWITLQTTQGQGDATVSFSVEPNLTGQKRQGLLYVAGNIMKVVQRSATETCAPLDIALGQTVSGNLAAGNCYSIVNNGAYAVRYKFTSKPGQFFGAALKSTAFDTYLTLIGPDGQVFYENDEYYYTDKNSNIPDLRAGRYTGVPIKGTYILEVSSFYPAKIGDFTLSLEKGCFFKVKSLNQKFSANGTPLGGVYNGANLEIEADQTCSQDQFQMFFFSNTDWLGSGQEPATNYSFNSYNRYWNVRLFDNKANIMIEMPINQDKQIRRGLLDFAGHKILIEQAAFCNGTNQPQIAPEKITFDGRKQRGTFQVKQAPNAFCTWDFKYETPDWLSYVEYNPIYTVRTSDQVINYEIQDNKTAVTRTFAMKVGDKTHTVEQESYDKVCPATLIAIGQTVNSAVEKSDCATSEQGQYIERYNFRGYAGQQVAFNLNVPTELVSVAIYSPPGNVIYSVAPYFDYLKSFRAPELGYYDLPLDGVYTVEIGTTNPLIATSAPYKFWVEALGGANCVFQIDRQFTAVKPEGGSFVVNLSATTTCPWTASSTGNWIQFPTGATGNSSQTITMQVAPNLGASRLSKVTIAGRQFEVFQDAPCTFMQLVDGSGIQVDGAYGRDYGGYLGVRFRTGNGCPLVVKNSLPWLKPGYSPYDDTVVFNLDKNIGALRRGEIEVSGFKVQVTQGAGNLAIVSAADYTPRISQEGIVSIFGEHLASTALGATTLPLPTNLSDVSALAFDSQNATYYPKLFYVSPSQVNLLLPETMPTGASRIEIYRTSGLVSSGTFTLVKTAPALFSAESTGAGIAAANIQRVKANGDQQFDIVSGVDAAGKIIGKPIDLGAADDRVYLVLYGVGIRLRNDLRNVFCEIDGQAIPVEYAGPQGYFAGLDQVNVLLPKSLRGKGEVTVRLKVEDKVSNTVKINVAP
jgi:uncharacterized protein (TIGR03437 family)